MSDTSQLFILAAAWSIIALFIARLPRRRFAKFALFLVLLGIPFWELPFGYYNFKRLCESDTAIKFHEPILPQSSICVDDLYLDIYGMFVHTGFARVEFRGGTNLGPLEMSSGIAYPTKRGAERSKYCFKTRTNLQQHSRILRHENLIVLVSDGRTVAHQYSFSWGGMWWQEYASPVLGRGGSCGSSLEQFFAAIK